MYRKSEQPDFNSRNVRGVNSLNDFITFRLSVLQPKLAKFAAGLVQDHADIRLPEWRVLALLNERGPMASHEIIDVTGIDKGLLSRTVKVLERAGYVIPQRPKENRRMLRLTLSDSGHDVVEKTMPAMRAHQQDMLDALSDDERTLLFEIVEKLEQRIDHLSDEK